MTLQSTDVALDAPLDDATCDKPVQVLMAPPPECFVRHKAANSVQDEPMSAQVPALHNRAATAW